MRLRLSQFVPVMAVILIVMCVAKTHHAVIVFSTHISKTITHYYQNKTKHVCTYSNAFESQNSIFLICFLKNCAILTCRLLMSAAMINKESRHLSVGSDEITLCLGFFKRNKKHSNVGGIYLRPVP